MHATVAASCHHGSDNPVINRKPKNLKNFCFPPTSSAAGSFWMACIKINGFPVLAWGGVGSNNEQMSFTWGGVTYLNTYQRNVSLCVN